MHDGVPVVLFLEDNSDHRWVARLAAAGGFRSLLAPWWCCEPVAQRVLVREASEVDADGTLRRLPGTLASRPDLIAVLSPLPAARRRGRELVDASGALWGHCDATAELRNGRVEDRGDVRGTDGCGSAGPAPGEGEAYGVAESGAASLRLRLVCLAPAPGPGRRMETERESALRSGVDDAFAALNRALGSAGSASTCRAVAPFALAVREGALHWLPDPLCARHEESGGAATPGAAIVRWLRHAHARSVVESPLNNVSDDRSLRAGDGGDLAIVAEHFPTLFQTHQFIDTEHLPTASFAYLDPALVPREVLPEETASAALHRLLCRRRSPTASGGAGSQSEQRLVEHGVGRSCLVDGLLLDGHPGFSDFTVLGVGLTPYSEGGFIEVGRPVDGKAAIVRGWHRKRCAERLEREGCRVARVVAIVEVQGETIQLVDGSLAPAGLVVRALRCVLRVKQLDPIVCALHSIQHTPLVSAYLTARVRELRAALDLPDTRGLVHDELLAREVERQGASQASLRRLLASSTSSTRRENAVEDWRALVARVRLDVIDGYAPRLLDLAKARVARELCRAPGSLDDTAYLHWFARRLGEQLAVWRRIRFLHDYHHVGVSRWRPGTLFSLGENNVTLLAEFPDLDTGLFVDDPAHDVAETLQLTEEDVTFLREHFLFCHHRELLAAETVLRTLALVMFRNDPRTVEDSLETFRQRYADV